MIMPQEFYPLTLIAILTVISFSTLIAIGSIYKTGHSSSTSPIAVKAFQFYFLYGYSGWIIYGIIDFMNYPLSLSWMAITFILAASIFPFMLSEDTAISTKNILWILSSLVFIISELIAPSREIQLWILTVYILIHLPLLAYIAYTRKRQTNNIGYGIITLALLIPAVIAIDQAYLLLNDYDQKIIIGLGVLASATSYSLVGLGFMTMLLVMQRDAYLTQSHIDPLTGIYNRRGLDNALEYILASCRRNSSQVCVIMSDIDHFKQINDSYGHKNGDIVLKAFADLLDSEKRNSDLIARFGGEEFIYILPQTGLEEAKVFAERVRKKIEKMQIPLEEKALKLTASFGIACQAGEIDMDTLIHTADQALYLAKTHGRNQIYAEKTI